MNSDCDFQKTRSVYVIDDDIDIRKSLYFMFSASNLNVRPFATVQDFLEDLPFLAPAPILLDIRMADIDGLQFLEMLKGLEIAWPVVVLTAHGDITTAVRAMKLGAIDFLEKPAQSDALDRAVAQAFDILDRIEHVLSARDQARYRMEQLTPRERETIAILMEGVHNKEAAHRLGLSVRTIEMHRANALTKLNVRSIAEVVKMVSVSGLSPRLDGFLEDPNED